MGCSQTERTEAVMRWTHFKTHRKMYIRKPSVRLPRFRNSLVPRRGGRRKCHGKALGKAMTRTTNSVLRATSHAIAHEQLGPHQELDLSRASTQEQVASSSLRFKGQNIHRFNSALEGFRTSSKLTMSSRGTLPLNSGYSIPVIGLGTWVGSLKAGH